MQLGGSTLDVAAWAFGAAGSATRVLLPIVALILGSKAITITAGYQDLLRTSLTLVLIGTTAFPSYRCVETAETIVPQRYRLDVRDNLEARSVYTQVKVLRKIATAIIRQRGYFAAYDLTQAGWRRSSSTDGSREASRVDGRPITRDAAWTTQAEFPNLAHGVLQQDVLCYSEIGMRLVRYGGAMSLDGYIAGPNGEYDWIVMDPDMDFAAMMNQFDTFLIGRKTFEAIARMGGDAPPTPGIQNIVFSRTLYPADYPQVVIESDAERIVADLRGKPGKDIALFGGGELFRSLLAAGLVDRIEFALVPVLLGGGIPLLPSPAQRAKLTLRKQRLYEKTGTIALEYDIVYS